MVGIDKIREYLGDFNANYVIIGGTACNLNLEDADLQGRTTKNIDMIVVCEVINVEYVKPRERMLIPLNTVSRNSDEKHRDEGVPRLYNNRQGNTQISRQKLKQIRLLIQILINNLPLLHTRN